MSKFDSALNDVSDILDNLINDVQKANTPKQYLRQSVYFAKYLLCSVKIIEMAGYKIGFAAADRFFKTCKRMLQICQQKGDELIMHPSVKQSQINKILDYRNTNAAVLKKLTEVVGI